MRKSVCEHCGASMMMNCATMSKHAARCLWKAFIHSEQIGRREFKTADLKLNRTEYPNFTKLKYWGFIERRGNYWRVTERALQFLRGDITVPAKIWYFRDEPQSTDGEVHITTIVDEHESREKYVELMRPYIGEMQMRWQL